MTLAPNHRLPLNGSKLVLFFLILISIFSCDPRSTAKRTSKRPTVVTSKPKPKTTKTKVDTVKWVEIDKTKKTEGNIPGVPHANTKDNYQISILMPFKGANSYSTDDNQSMEEYINYYAGVKMALSDLEQKGLNASIQVFDEDVDFNKTIYSSSFKKSDIIIGPRNKDKLKKVVNIGKRDQILVVSPWWTSPKMTTDNPYYLQLNPSTKERYLALLKHAKSHFNNDEIIIIQREDSKDQKRTAYFQKLNQAMNGPDGSPLQTFTVNTDSLANGETAFDELIFPEEERTLALIVPNWSSQDEYYLYSCLRKLSVEKGLNNITVYAMSKVLTSDLIGYELYKNLHIKVATERYIDAHDPNVKQFRRRYFEEYNAIATDDAIEGYDMMHFIGQHLLQNGNNFPAFLSNGQRMSQMKYDIQPIHDADDISDEHYENVQYYQNNHVDIISFEGYQFKREP